MDRHSLSAGFSLAVFSGGVAAIIGATALQKGSPYFDFLMYGGLTAIVAGACGLAWLFIFPGSGRPAPTQTDPPAVEVQAGVHLTGAGNSLRDSKLEIGETTGPGLLLTGEGNTVSGCDVTYYGTGTALGIGGTAVDERKAREEAERRAYEIRNGRDPGPPATPTEHLVNIGPACHQNEVTLENIKGGEGYGAARIDAHATKNKVSVKNWDQKGA